MRIECSREPAGLSFVVRSSGAAPGARHPLVQGDWREPAGINSMADGIGLGMEPGTYSDHWLASKSSRLCFSSGILSCDLAQQRVATLGSPLAVGLLTCVARLLRSSSCHFAFKDATKLVCDVPPHLALAPSGCNCVKCNLKFPAEGSQVWVSRNTTFQRRIL